MPSFEEIQTSIHHSDHHLQRLDPASFVGHLRAAFGTSPAALTFLANPVGVSWFCPALARGCHLKGFDADRPTKRGLGAHPGGSAWRSAVQRCLPQWAQGHCGMMVIRCWNDVGATMLKADRRGNLYPAKLRSEQKIGAALAPMMAVGWAVTMDDAKLDGFLSNPLSL
jgi:hypothetical protein